MYSRIAHLGGIPGAAGGLSRLGNSGKNRDAVIRVLKVEQVNQAGGGITTPSRDQTSRCLIRAVGILANPLFQQTKSSGMVGDFGEDVSTSAEGTDANDGNTRTITDRNSCAVELILNPVALGSLGRNNVVIVTLEINLRLI